MGNEVRHQAPDDRAWLQKALTAGGVGIWEWDHQSGAVRLCLGAAEMLAGNASLAWSNLKFSDALSAVDREDVGDLLAQLYSSVYFANMKLGPYRVSSVNSGTRQILMRGRTSLALNGTPSQTSGVVIDVTNNTSKADEHSTNDKTDALDEAARHGISAYDAIQVSGVASLVAPVRTLLLAIDCEIALRMNSGRKKSH